jgi:hypothetical protein
MADELRSARFPLAEEAPSRRSRAIGLATVEEGQQLGDDLGTGMGELITALRKGATIPCCLWEAETTPAKGCLTGAPVVPPKGPEQPSMTPGG